MVEETQDITMISEKPSFFKTDPEEAKAYANVENLRGYFQSEAD